MFKFILVASFVAATTCSAVAKEVCRDVKVRQVNCKTVNGEQSCTVSYEDAQICKEVPDSPAKAAAAGRADQILQPDNENNYGSNNNIQFIKKGTLFIQ